MSGEAYECEKPPCLHVVVDYRRKRFAVFLETADGDLIHIPAERIEDAYNKIVALRSRRFREAVGSEVDEIAEDILGAVPVEEE
ncbi:hypothetical protein [Hyperthermus butylicus]|uniref:Uncharacterized protein n=1 Tax=Hyperthermus butylicus (strain DSM 5456 / JCM 9403 / PLM1-5) TaxID=415426 RepID=A2BJN2_HYPBU|nr:hypothetical protein [Hyperthermus butylicus]ABM80193.1 hypothetical protein Hbut_0321 [Hyperthermus butylicus DSM 5456]